MKAEEEFLVIEHLTQSRTSTGTIVKTSDVTQERIVTEAASKLTTIEHLQLIGEGTFSEVFKLIDEAAQTSYAVKVSRPRRQAMQDCPTGYFGTRALVPITGAYGEAKPIPADLLKKQYERFSNIVCNGWVSVIDICKVEEQTCIVLEYDQSPTLRDLIRSGAVKDKIGTQIAQCMSRLLACNQVKYHGDLKPENILVSHDNPRLIDPGFFGSIETELHTQMKMKVTTWQYYPWLMPDDRFAMGLILLELSTSSHPFFVEGIQPESSRIGPILKKKIETADLGGNSFAKNIALIPGFLDAFELFIPSELRKIALKCMGLEELKDGTIECCESYDSFDIVASELFKLD
ncbi:MAG: protein kinase family protein [Candidatus Melainabacteria bacterium]|nr:protein kinase family protein [Candidatus Melainabacteria bacterium]